MERSVRAILRAETGQYEAGMGRAAKATSQVGTAAEEASRKTRQSTQEQTTAARSFSQNLVKSARENEQAWTQVGGALTVAGGATTALMGVVLNTGISYNQLRQSSVAALTTLTGSAQAANAQMDKLDAFASTSPFARDVFIRAQQQMLGFGIEASKVVPYLDAIQNAVAAAGGSNHDIAELSRIMSQISASAKITATDLREFGNRGVDAATIIGSQMGKTGAEIREEITAGTLDANQALDALAAGMSTTFDGAADGVKNTFAGAVDRVKAAFRDLSSIVAEPLVGREGGGLFTGALNELADFLRLVEDLPAPVVQVAGALTGLGGLAALAAGGFMLLLPRLVETWDAARKLGIELPTLSGRLSGVDFRGFARNASIAAAAVTTAMVAMRALNETSAPTSAGIEEVRRSLMDLGQSGNDITSLFDDIELGWLHRPLWGDASVVRDLDDFQSQLRRMTDEGLLGKVERGLVGLSGAWEDSLQGQFEERIGQASEIISSLVQSGDLETAAQMFTDLSMAAGGTDQASLELLEYMPGLRDALVGVANEAGLATDDATLLKLALGYIAPEAEAAAAAVHGYEGIVADMATRQREATDALQEWRDGVAEATGSFGGVLGAYQSVIDKNREVAESTAAATESSKDSWEDYYDGVSVSAEDWLAALSAQAEAVTNWQQNLLTATAQIREQLPADLHAAADAMIDEMMLAGPEGAAAVAAFLELTPEQKAEAIAEWGVTGEAAALAFTAQMEEARQPEMGASFVPAEDALDMFLGAVAEGQGFVTIDGYTVPAENVLSALRNQIATTDASMPINGDEVPVREVLDAVTQAIADEEEDVTINGNRLPVDQVVGTLMAWIAQQEASVTVNADTAVAMSRLATLDNTLNSINGKTVTATVAIQQYGQAAIASGGYAGDFLAGGGQPRKRYTMGGEVFGPGTPTSDDVPAMLSRKEFVQRAAAVDYYGVDTMYALNNMRIPRERLVAGLAGGGQLRDALGGGAHASMRTHSIPVPASLPRPATTTVAGAQFTANLYGVPMDATRQVSGDVLFAMRRYATETGYSGGGR